MSRWDQYTDSESVCNQHETRTPDNWKPLGDLVKQAVAEAASKLEGER